MGYTLTQNAVARVRPYLDEMSASDTDCTWITDDPRLAYRIREGIAASRALGLKDYAKLYSKFLLKSGKNRVIAELRDKLGLDVLLEEARKTVIHDVTTLSGVVGAAIKHKSPEIQFPNVTLDNDEIEKLFKWTSQNDYLVVVTGGGLLLTKDEGMEDIAYGSESAS